MHKLIAALFISQIAGLSPEAPFREPQIAAVPGLTAVAFGTGTGIYVATSIDNGLNFTQPVKVDGASRVLLTHHRGPRMASAGSAIVVTAVVGEGDLLAWRSVDRGLTWSAPVTINDVPAASAEALHTLASDGRGHLFAAWLDHRQKGTRLYGAWSSDAGATWSKNVEVYSSPDGTICQCCHPTAIFDQSGGIEVMWRNVIDGSRDLYLLHADSMHRFGKAEKLGEGSWKLNACPMDGGAMVDAGGKTITVWRRTDKIFMAEPGKPEQKIGDGKDVTLAFSHGQTYVAWIKAGELVLWTSGKQQTIAEEAGFPNLAALPGGGALLAWEEKSGISFKRLP